MNDNNIVSSALLNIASELGLDKLKPEARDEIMFRISQLALEKIFLETLERLDDAGRVEYEKMIEASASPEQVGEYLNSKIPGYEKFVQQIVDQMKEDMKKELLGVTADAI